MIHVKVMFLRQNRVRDCNIKIYHHVHGASHDLSLSFHISHVVSVWHFKKVHSYHMFGLLAVALNVIQVPKIIDFWCYGRI